MQARTLLAITSVLQLVSGLANLDLHPVTKYSDTTHNTPTHSAAKLTSGTLLSDRHPPELHAGNLCYLFDASVCLSLVFGRLPRNLLWLEDWHMDIHRWVLCADMRECLQKHKHTHEHVICFVIGVGFPEKRRVRKKVAQLGCEDCK